ncbi:hypothetical protein BDY24DRAFT_411484 [Mrakia frigida]|uniref:uncharacterized protein n=1 Tax=Mrakia frigida TaxID=29902 RepID=UPI003FCC0AB9
MSSSYQTSSSSSPSTSSSSSPSPLASTSSSSSSSSHYNFDAADNPGPLLSRTNNLILDIVVPIVAVLLVLGGFIFFRRARRQKVKAEKERVGFVEMGGSPIRGGGSGGKEDDLERGLPEMEKERGGGWEDRVNRRSRQDLT